MPSKLKVLFVASEMAPLAKVGGLGDVIGSLPRALKKIGVDAEVIIPRYEQISKKNLALICRLDKNTVIYRTKSNGVTVYLIDNAKYLSRGPIYFERTAFAKSEKEIKRFIFFSEAVFRFLKICVVCPDIVHANDWHTGALMTMLRSQNAKSQNQKLKTVFTIHNLANQGRWRGKNFMSEGIKGTDLVTTVSPTYAKEIVTKKYGAGLENFLRTRAREKKLVGILNGVDYDFWPAQGRNKIKFQKKLRFEVNRASPIFGLTARLTYQKGINLIMPLVGKFVKKYGAGFVFLGQGEKKYEKALQRLAVLHPKNVFTKIGFDEKFAREIYAQSDFFLMPSLFEPSGLGQMIAMHYGTVPIVRATGGLKDSVKDLKTGFVFKKESSGALLSVMEKALNYFHKHSKLKRLIRNCKAQDFSWNKSARKYFDIYDTH